MGLVCPCGVLVKGSSRKENVYFTGQRGRVKGELSYLANVCVTRLDTSSLSLKFVDKDMKGKDNSFVFEATTITSVDCCHAGQNCEVFVTGYGEIDDVLYSFEAIFIDKAASSQIDIVQDFEITGFFNQNGSAAVPQGSIVALGC